MHISELGIHT